MSIKLQRSLTALLAALALAGCGDKVVQRDITGPALTSSVLFFNFGVNAPSVNFYADTTKLTAIASATGSESTNGTAYGSVGNGALYTGVAAGPHTLTGKISATTDNNLAISSVATTVDANKQYSYYISGFYNTTTKQAEAFVVEDAIPAITDYSVAYVRFVNAISNSSPMTLYAKNTTTGTETAIGAAITYKSAGAFTAVPSGAYDLSTRVAGSSTNVIARTGVSFAGGRVYSISARGDITVVSTTATNRPFLDNTANR